jgi:hypothetical protein
VGAVVEDYGGDAGTFEIETSEGGCYEVVDCVFLEVLVEEDGMLFL